jgi:hypothetical protein
MPRNRLVAKCLDFVFRDAEPPHRLGHLADDAEVIARAIQSHNQLGMFGGHRDGTMRRDGGLSKTVDLPFKDGNPTPLGCPTADCCLEVWIVQK